jgi:hypothetical protein
MSLRDRLKRRPMRPTIPDLTPEQRDRLIIAAHRAAMTVLRRQAVGLIGKISPILRGHE